MRLRRSLALLPAFAVLVLVAVLGPAAGSASAATDYSTANFCAGVQRSTASLTDAQVADIGGITNVIYNDIDSYLLSKSSDTPLTTRQFSVLGDDGVTEIFCKGRSVDALQAVYGADDAGPEQPCSVYLNQEVQDAWAGIPAAEQAVSAYTPSDVTVLADAVEDIGPTWATFVPPFQTIKKAGSKLTVQSDSIYVSINDPENVPITFKGNHYCTLPAITDLRQALRGTAAVATATPTPTPTPTASASTSATASAAATTAAADPSTSSDASDSGATLAATGSNNVPLLLLSLVLLQIGVVLAVRSHRAGRRAQH